MKNKKLVLTLIFIAVFALIIIIGVTGYSSLKSATFAFDVVDELAIKKLELATSVLNTIVISLTIAASAILISLKDK